MRTDMPPTSDDKSAKERILDAAGDVFGRMGYKAATIREICRSAGVNVAAINYHFGGKRELYRIVVTELLARTFSHYPVDAGIGARSSPQDRLRAFIHGTLKRLLSPDGLSGYPGKGQLAARELADPSPYLDDMVDRFIRPTAAVLSTIIAELLGPGADTQQIMRCQVSVIGQCFHYALARPIVSRLIAIDVSDETVIDALTDHITCFSLAGIEAVRASIHDGGTHPTPTHEPRTKGEAS
jgi:AcrR family transcriptional regulator